MTTTMFAAAHGGTIESREPTDVCVLAGSGSPALAADVAARVGVAITPCAARRFPDGECSVTIGGDVGRRDVIVVQSVRPPVNDHLVELLAMVDAARRSDAARVIALLPYLGYARSDRRSSPGTPVMASLVAKLLEVAGVDHVLTLDVHAPAIEGFFHVPMDDASALPAMVRAARDRIPSAAVVVAPDFGAVHRATRVAELLDADVAVCHKRRTGAATVSVMHLSGDVAGRRCVIVDDMITTGATIAECARALRAAGARPRPIVLATHAVLSDGAERALRDAEPALVVVTDSIPGAAVRARDLPLEVVPIGAALGEAAVATLARSARRHEQSSQEAPCRIDYTIEPKLGGRWPAD